MIAQLIAMAPQQGQGQGGSMVSTLIMFGAIFAIFYFMIIRPQQKRQKEHQNLLSNVQKGDKVLLTGGIHGKIHTIEEKTFIVEIDANTKIKVEKGSITSVIKS